MGYTSKEWEDFIETLSKSEFWPRSLLKVAHDGDGYGKGTFEILCEDGTKPDRHAMDDIESLAKFIIPNGFKRITNKGSSVLWILPLQELGNNVPTEIKNPLERLTKAEV